MLITILITVLACQLIIFILVNTDKIYDETVQNILCGIWFVLAGLFGLIAIPFCRKVKKEQKVKRKK